MRIKKVTVWVFPYGNRPVVTKHNPVILRIDTDEGIQGAGEVGLAYGIGAKAGVGMVEEIARHLLIGADPFRIEDLWDRMFRSTFWGQNGGPAIYGAISAIDEALWDIKGKALGVPVWQLLGGKVRDEVRVYANGWFGGLHAPEAYADGARAVIEEGYDALKFDPFMGKPGGAIEFPPRHIDREWALSAVARVAAVRDAVGESIDIMLDLHGNLGPTDAIQYGRMLEPYRPFFYEEPVDPTNVECTLKVGREVEMPIAGGERLYTRYQFRPFIEGQAYDILQPDIGLCGGISEARKIAAHAEIYGLHVQPHNCGGPVSTAAGLQVIAATPNAIVKELFPYFKDGRYDIVTDALEGRVRNGRLQVPDDPGLGVTLNEDYLYRFDSVEIGPE